MLSLFYPVLEIKVPNSVKVLISEPKQKNESQQIIIIQGKLGQFKLIWSSSVMYLASQHMIANSQGIPVPKRESEKQEKKCPNLKKRDSWDMESESEYESEYKSERTELGCSRSDSSSESESSSSSSNRFRSEIVFRLVSRDSSSTRNQNSGKDPSFLLGSLGSTPTMTTPTTPMTRTTTTTTTPTTPTTTPTKNLGSRGDLRGILQMPDRNKHFVCEFPFGLDASHWLEGKKSRSEAKNKDPFFGSPIKDIFLSPAPLHLNWPFFEEGIQSSSQEDPVRFLSLGYLVNPYPEKSRKKGQKKKSNLRDVCIPPGESFGYKNQGSKPSSDKTKEKAEEISNLIGEKKHLDHEHFSRWRQSIKDFFTGVSQGYMQTLEFQGIGFTAKTIHVIRSSSSWGISSGDFFPRALQSALLRSTGKMPKAASWDSSPTSQSPSPSTSPSTSPWRDENRHCIFDKILWYGEDKRAGRIENILRKISKLWQRFQGQAVLSSPSGTRKTVKPYERAGFHSKSSLPLLEDAKYLILNLGFSYSLFHTIPKNHVTINIYNSDSSHNEIVLIFGISKFKVNRVAADIYKYKEPEPYKEKGIRYDGEKFFSKKSSAKKTGKRT